MNDPLPNIERALYRYAWSFDSGNLDEIGDLFTAEAQVEFHDTGLKVGRSAIVDELRRRRQLYSTGDLPWHLITNTLVTKLEEGRAEVRSQWTVFVASGAGSAQLRGTGWYDDVFESDGDIWQVARRHVRFPSIEQARGR